MLRLGGEDFHLVAALQFVAQGHELVVNLGTDTVAAEEGVYREGEVEGSASCRHGLNLAFRCEHEYLRSKEVELDGVEEVHCVRLRVVENLLDGMQPLVEFSLVLGELYFSSLLVFPMGSKSLFGNLVHAVGAYLHLYPSTLI